VADKFGDGRSNGPEEFATFIVRVSKDTTGSMSGVVEWVRTGQRAQFRELAGISEVISRMLKRARS